MRQGPLGFIYLPVQMESTASKFDRAKGISSGEIKKSANLAFPLNSFVPGYALTG